MTAVAEARLIDLRVTLTTGAEADTLEVRLSDPLATLARPAVERAIRVWLGYDGALSYLGTYYHAESVIDLAPRRMTIRAASADWRRDRDLKAPRTRGWHSTTLGEILTKIASQHRYAPAIEPRLASIPIAHADQTSESDLGFLRRLARDHAATVRGVGGHLVIALRGAGRGVTAQDGYGALPVVRIDRDGADVIEGGVTWRGRPRYAAVRAAYVDTSAGGGLRHVVVGDPSPAAGPTWVARQVHATRVEALDAAQARFARLARQTATLTLRVPGDPRIVAEGRLVTDGWGSDLDGVWTVAQASHSISPRSGYVTRLQAALTSSY